MLPEAICAPATDAALTSSAHIRTSTRFMYGTPWCGTTPEDFRASHRLSQAGEFVHGKMAPSVAKRYSTSAGIRNDESPLGFLCKTGRSLVRGEPLAN